MIAAADVKCYFHALRLQRLLRGALPRRPYPQIVRMVTAEIVEWAAERFFKVPDDMTEGLIRAVELNNMLFSAALSSMLVLGNDAHRDLTLVDAIEGEEMVRANPLDGLVVLANCDKSVPGALMGAISANVPTVLVYPEAFVAPDQEALGNVVLEHDSGRLGETSSSCAAISASSLAPERIIASITA